MSEVATEHGGDDGRPELAPASATARLVALHNRTARMALSAMVSARYWADRSSSSTEDRRRAYSAWQFINAATQPLAMGRAHEYVDGAWTEEGVTPPSRSSANSPITSQQSLYLMRPWVDNSRPLDKSEDSSDSLDRILSGAVSKKSAKSYRRSSVAQLTAA